MPELPDLKSYLLALRRMIVGQSLVQVIIRSPFVLHTFDPPRSPPRGCSAASDE